MAAAAFDAADASLQQPAIAEAEQAPLNPGHSPASVAQVNFSLREEVMKFMTDIGFVQTLENPEDRFVEADPRIISHFQRAGVGETGYFWYQGVKVYEKGRKKEVDARDALSIDQRTFGSEKK